jgi:hypothetical protein
MTPKSSIEDPSTEVTDSQERQPYTTPSLVRYGTLFVQTGEDDPNASPCTGTDDPDKMDICDPDGDNGKDGTDGANDGSMPV